MIVEISENSEIVKDSIVVHVHQDVEVVHVSAKREEAVTVRWMIWIDVNDEIETGKCYFICIQ